MTNVSIGQRKIIEKLKSYFQREASRFEEAGGVKSLLLTFWFVEYRKYG